MTIGQLKELLEEIPDDYELKTYDYEVNEEGNDVVGYERAVCGLCVYDRTKEVYGTWINCKGVDLPAGGCFLS